MVIVTNANSMTLFLEFYFYRSEKKIVKVEDLPKNCQEWVKIPNLIIFELFQNVTPQKKTRQKGLWSKSADKEKWNISPQNYCKSMFFPRLFLLIIQFQP